MTATKPTMSTMTYDQTFETILGVSASGIVLCALWIVAILVTIEANKAAFHSVQVDHSLEMQEEGVEMEKPESPKASTAPQMKPKKKGRRVRMSFKLMQVASVAVLILLTYLLLVVSNAPMWLSIVGSLCVFWIFLRFQIGDELRRQRLDRVTLMMSLFLLIASLMSMSTYAMKSLAKGEVYEGPARIVGYDASTYNNTEHDPSTRTDLMVQWGKNWGCPLSGGKVCQAHVHGAMCQVQTEEDGNRKRKRRRRRRKLADDGDNQDAGDATEDEDEDTQDLEQENADLETQNEELQQEVEGT
jgi:hypothetical protein